MSRLFHTFEPIYDGGSRVLILGSFPSARSREQGFYYGNPQNRFWRLMARLTREPEPPDADGKRALLLRHGIALWDAAGSCEITGSSDAAIRGAEPNDIGLILKSSPIERIFANGAAAARLYRALTQPLTGMPITALPSTSPANASWTLGRLYEEWGRALGEYLE